MIDTFALALSHGLLFLAAWRLLSRPDLDDETAPQPAAGEAKGGRLVDRLRKGRGDA